MLVRRVQLFLFLLLPFWWCGCAVEKADGRPYVWKIRVDGAHKLKASDIIAKISISETSWIPFAYKHYLDPFATDVDRKRIEAFYAANGYFAAKVTRVDVTPRGKDGKSVNVRFVVEEGLPTKISKVTVLNVDKVQNDIKGWMGSVHKRLRVGDIFVHDTFESEKDKLEHELKEHGYAWAKATGSAEVDRDRLTAELTLVAEPGVKAKFGAPVIEGNEKTSAKLSLVHAELPTGKTYDPDAIDDARGSLYNLGTFSSVRITTEHDPDHDDIASPKIKVTEGQFRELRLGGGFGAEGLTSGVERVDVHLLVSYTKNNFLGGFRTLRLSLKPAYVLYRSGSLTRYGPAVAAEAELTQPDLWWSRLKLRWLVAYDVGIELEYQYTGPRTLVGLSRPFFHNRLNLGLSYNFQYWKFFNTDPTILNNPTAAGALFGYEDPYRLGWLQQDFVLDLRDKPLDTHYGAYFGLTLEEGGEYAGGAFLYEKFQPDVRAYIPLGKRITLAGRWEYGEIHSQEGGTPISRRFFEGGPSSHRGFTYDRLSPQVYDARYQTLLPVGGDKMVLMQAEVRAQLFKLFDNWFGVVAFFDAGDVASTPLTAGSCPTSLTQARSPLCGWSTNIDYGNLHLATGAGLRYKTVIGTVRVDLGVRLNRLGYGKYQQDATTGLYVNNGSGPSNPDPGQRFAFHISIGEAF